MKIIKEQEVLGKQLKVYGNFDEPLFLAKDVAEWIEHSNVTVMLQSIDNDEQLKISPKECLGLLTSNNTYNFLTEDGLYEVLMQSRKPIAKSFKKEVKAILKDIRKHGVYAPSEMLDNPDLMIEALMQLKKEREEKSILNQTVALQNQQILEMQPKANYYDVVLNCKDLVSASTIAKDYGFSAQKLNKLLKNEKVQYKQGNIWLLYQNHATNGYTSTKTCTYRDNDGTEHTKPHTYWTQKGRLFIYEMLKAKEIVPLIEMEIAYE